MFLDNMVQWSIGDPKSRQAYKDEDRRLWDLLTEDNRAGFMQTVDIIISIARADGIIDGELDIEGSADLSLAFDKFIVGRMQTPEDDWHRLPTYQGWRVASHPLLRPIYPTMQLSYKYQGKKKKKRRKISFIVPPEAITAEERENLEMLASLPSAETLTLEQLLVSAKELTR